MLPHHILVRLERLTGRRYRRHQVKNNALVQLCYNVGDTLRTLDYYDGIM